ncbi:hypothetical protein [Azospirillum canadense]|uniref:hypothetical protein n=1 Tax=Azospirillum canadense TaxID=403962 RepID=UPI00222796BC|nr:hypothetical protein [Azospirillum canadense]MCW2242542.1 hypothetical protein [Azospirillum canadense]
MAGGPSRVDEEKAAEVVTERFVALARQFTPPASPQKPSRDGMGAARWIQRLYDEITTMRAAGWKWKHIVALLKQSRVPLSGGAAWSVKTVMCLYKTERDKRAGRGTWRAIKRACASGDGNGVGAGAEPLGVREASDGWRAALGGRRMVAAWSRRSGMRWRARRGVWVSERRGRELAGAWAGG